MSKKIVRNFKCPESDESCTNTGCTNVVCRDREEARAYGERSAAIKKVQQQHAKVWEIVGPLIEKARQK